MGNRDIFIVSFFGSLGQLQQRMGLGRSQLKGSLQFRLMRPRHIAAKLFRQIAN
jgi:hypothetical protein